MCSLKQGIVASTATENKHVRALWSITMDCYFIWSIRCRDI